MCECVGQRKVCLHRSEAYVHRWQGNGLCTWFLLKQWQKRLAFTSFGISYMLLGRKLRNVTSSKTSGKGTPRLCPAMKGTNELVKTESQFWYEPKPEANQGKRGKRSCCLWSCHSSSPFWQQPTACSPYDPWYTLLVLS